MKAQIEAASLKRLIQATRGFIGENKSRPIQEFIRLEFSKEFSLVTAISLDGYRMSVEHAACAVDEDFTAYIKPILPPMRKSSWAEIELRENVCYINANGRITGYQHPQGEFIDWGKALSDAEQKPSQYRIGFNGEFLLSALQAAKVSSGNVFRRPIVLEFRSPCDPMLIKTNQNDVKMVLPVRLRAEAEK